MSSSTSSSSSSGSNPRSSSRSPLSALLSSIEYLVTFTNKFEPRDKICKAIQYGSRFLKWAMVDSHPDLSSRFDGLFVGMKNARKLFRLAKTLNEIDKIRAIVSSDKLDKTDKTLQVLARAGFGVFWLFDNFSILHAVRFLRNPSVNHAKISAGGWLFGLAFTILGAIRNLSRGAKSGVNPVTSYLEIIRSLGDSVTASSVLEIPTALFGSNFNDGAVGVGGFLSSIISLYMMASA